MLSRINWIENQHTEHMYYRPTHISCKFQKFNRRCFLAYKCTKHSYTLHLCYYSLERFVLGFVDMYIFVCVIWIAMHRMQLSRSSAFICTLNANCSILFIPIDTIWNISHNMRWSLNHHSTTVLFLSIAIINIK